MKIAFLLRDLHIGGLEKVTVQVAAMLSKTHSVDILVFSKNNQSIPTQGCRVLEGNISYTIAEKVVKRLNRLTFKVPRLLFYKEVRFLQQVVQQNEYDCIIASDGYNSIILQVAMDTAGFAKSPRTIGWMHNEYAIYFNSYLKKVRKLFEDKLSRLDGIITLTTADKELFKKHNAHTVSISNPLTLENPRVSSLENKEILFVSRLSKEQKGLDFLVQIAEHIRGRGWHISVVGQGKDESWLKEEVKKKDLGDTLIMHGLVTSNLVDIYANASIFISTSRWEGFGLSILEAMSCGLPVVAFNNAGPSEILANGNGLLVEKENVAAFVEALESLMHNREKLEQYSVVAKNRVADFSVDTITGKWQEVLEKSLSKG